jgi:hypothetical protein
MVNIVAIAPIVNVVNIVTVVTVVAVVATPLGITSSISSTYRVKGNGHSVPVYTMKAHGIVGI